jgi:SWIM/SEC-C metal-binding protein
MAKLGSNKRPAVIRVQTMEKAEEIIALCDERGWKVIVGIEPDKPEDLSDLERLINPPSPISSKPKVGRNDPCPCGSGLKFKKCCLRKYG